MLRIATAAVLAPLLWVAIKLAPASVFYAAALVLIGVALWECFELLERAGTNPLKRFGLLGGVAVVVSFVVADPSFATRLPLAATAIGTLVLAMTRRDDPRAMLSTSMSTLFPVVLVGVGLGFLPAIRGIARPDGPDLLLLLFLCVIFSDTAAFFVGSRVGRRRLAPVLSPKKSWEGLIAGLLASGVAAILAHVWFYQRLPLVHALILGVLLGVAGVFGDLAVSMIKRASGAKDASSLIPGHGGVLDRTDSLLFAGPVLYYYYRWLLQGAS